MTHRRPEGVPALFALLAILGACHPPPVGKVLSTLNVQVAVDGGTGSGLAELLDAGLDFGSVPVLVPVTQTLALSDLSGAGLSLTGVDLEPDGGPFSLVGAVPAEVPAGQPVPLTLQFLPALMQSYQGAITFTSADTKTPTVTIALRGTGSTEGKIQVTPPKTLDFGMVGQGQTQNATLTIASVGTAPLRVGAIALGPGSDPAFAFISSTKTPLTLSNVAPGNTLPLLLSFAPTAQTSAYPLGSVVIQSSDPTQTTVTIQLTAKTVLAPTPKISVPMTVAVGSLVTLDGTGSSDPNQPPLLPLTYQWALTYKELGSTAAISDVTAPKPTLTADVPGTYTVQLDVTNDAGVQDVAPATASFVARPLDDLYVELVWDNMPVDLDLHFVGPGGAIEGAGDCTADFQDAGFGCSHSSDHLLGPGPEWASVASPAAGTYTLYGVFFAFHNAQSLTTHATARVYVYGVLTAEQTATLDMAGQTWDALTVAWPGGAVTSVNTVSP